MIIDYWKHNDSKIFLYHDAEIWEFALVLVLVELIRNRYYTSSSSKFNLLLRAIAKRGM
jgi:hypothetical protein